jgi:TolB-like protein/Flp pilus assembly protein TadD
MALVFSSTVEAPIQCAIEISEALQSYKNLRVRMGIHSGPVSGVEDVNDQSNAAGAGINLAQRVMERGDANHILLSKHVAEDLEQYPRWQPHLHDLGECEIKHGRKLGFVNFYTADIGNRDIPAKFKEQARQKRLRRSNRLWISGIGLAAVVMVAAGIWVWLRHPGDNLAKSIAVLPFENLSDDKANAYFAGGIQDDILTNLSKIGDLKVISRTSVARYADSQHNVREIGKALGVAAVLEGSVRRFDNRVRINVQLISTATDEHLWAEDYDRELTDILAIQTDLAFRIASTLQSKLSPLEKARLKIRPTENGEAYLTYLQAHDGELRGELETATGLYEKAIQIDPAFALAFARLSYVQNTLYQSTGDRSFLEKARVAANEAVRLQPAMPEAHVALGYNYYRGNRDYVNALRELTIAQAGLPNNAEIFLVIGSIERRQGKWAESTRHLQKAASLNPTSGSLWANLGTNYRAMGDFPAAAKSFERGIAAEPDFFMNHWLRARLELDWKGDFSAIEQLADKMKAEPDPIGQVALARYYCRILQRRYNEALQILNASKVERFSAWQAPTPLLKSLLVGLTCQFLDDRAEAQRHFEEAQKTLERGIVENPADASRHALLGQAYAGLGRTDDAVREGARALELAPESTDSLDAPGMILALARIQTLNGNFDAAFELLDHSLSSPRGISTHWLRLDPAWDPLRKDPRFEKMLASIAPQKSP